MNICSKLFLSFLLCLLFVLPINAGEMRNWTGSNGKVIEAEVVSFDPTTEIVHLKLENGKDSKVNISLFSSEDQKLIKNSGKTSDNPFAKTNNEATNQITRLTLNVDEFGEGVIQIEKTDKLLNGKDGETPIVSSTLQSTRLFKSKNKLVRIIHDFSNPDPFETWGLFQMPEGYGANIDKKQIQNNRFKLT